MVEPILNPSSVCVQGFASNNTTTLNEYVREFGRRVMRWYFIWMVKDVSRIMNLQYCYL